MPSKMEAPPNEARAKREKKQLYEFSFGWSTNRERTERNPHYDRRSSRQKESENHVYENL